MSQRPGMPAHGRPEPYPQPPADPISGEASPEPGDPRESPTARTWRLGWRFWAKLAGAYAVALTVVLLLPMEREGAGGPPMRLLLAAALLTSAVFTPVLWWVIRRDLRLPVRIAVYAVTFNVLVLLVKFAFAPHGLYEANRSKVFESFAPIDSGDGAILAAGCVFLLYALALLAVYLLARARLPRAMRRPRGRFWRGFGLVTGVLVVTAALLTGGAILIVGLLAADSGLTYVEFVFSSSASLAVAVQLAAATGLAALAFRDAAEQSRVVGDASLMAALFWVCLAFLALYHALWVVYVLLLTSVWPLKTVVPK